MPHTLCPERPRMNVLVQGPLPEDEERRLADHLDHCLDCQERAEELTGLGTWTGHHLTRTAPQLRRVIDSMKNKDQLTAPGMGALPVDDSVLLSFLQPAPNSDCLGKLNGYEVTEVLGRGGMGIVLKAFDPSLERFVAIKVLAPQLATSPSARERFAREARAAAAINHEHVVAIHDVDRVDGLPYLVMEYVAGLSLQELLDRDGPLPLVETLRIGAKVASGLAAAHAQGLVHRDIKPANILLAPEVPYPDKEDQEPGTRDEGPWTPKISDFGLARTADDASLTQSGMLAGTPHYMAPEQARGEPLDARADLFSLGSVLYALCTGEPPFPDGSTLAVLRQVSETRPPSVRRLNPSIPYWFDELIARLHAPNRDARFASAADVAELLERCVAHVQQPDRVPLPAELTVSNDRRRFLRRWAIPALALVALLGVLAAVANGLTGQGPIQQRDARGSAVSSASGPSNTDNLNYVPVDPEKQVQVAGRHVHVKGPTGTVKGNGSALELNLKLPGAQRARILIFGLPGIAVDAGPCASQTMPSVALPEPPAPPCAAHSTRSTETSDQVRKDSASAPLLCLVFADVGCVASTMPGFASLIYWQPRYAPVVIMPRPSKDRLARRLIKPPERALLSGPLQG